MDFKVIQTIIMTKLQSFTDHHHFMMILEQDLTSEVGKKSWMAKDWKTISISNISKYSFPVTHVTQV